MDRTSKNGLDLIGIAGGKLKGVWGKGFLGTLMYVTPIVALLFVPYVGWALAIAVFGWLTAGYVEFMKGLLSGNNPSYAMIFTTVHEFAQATLIGVILCCGTILGSVIFIVPGIIIIGFYSMSFFVLDEEAITSVSDTLNLASMKMEGNKSYIQQIANMLGVEINEEFKIRPTEYGKVLGCKEIDKVFRFDIALIAFIFIARLYATQQALAICLGIVDLLVTLVLLSIVTLYFYASNVVFYNEIVRQTAVEYTVKRPVEGTDLTELNITSGNEEAKQEVKVEQPKEETKVEEVKAEVKKAPAKKPATKAPAKKATTSAKSTATKTTEAKTEVAKKPAAKKATTATTAKKTTSKK